jgi:sugar/nucleoside kinase (ribokinase family)
MQRHLEVVTVGHASVDVLAPATDDLVASLGLAKGTMTLVDDDRAQVVYAAIGPTTAVSGGSAANTAAGLASLGASAAFVGKVADDPLGHVFTHDLRAAGVDYRVPLSADGPGTGRCLIMVTPDAEKTMCTFLGVGDLLAPADVDVDLVRSADVVYIEGYLCGLEHTDGTVERTITAARAGGTTVALSLSDPLWVELHGASLDRLLDRVDLLFANEHEACGLTGAHEVGKAIGLLAERCATVAVTLGAEGSLVASGGETTAVAAHAVARAVDTTGAGDLYAAGFLYGMTRGLDAERCARLGGLAAAEVVSHVGARPLQSLAALVQADGQDIAG